MGKYLRVLDSKSRFIPPDEFKNYLTSEVYITQGFDNNLWILSNSAFQEIYRKLKHLNITDPLARLLFRLLLGAATEIGISEQGYLSIPKNLREYANIGKEILLIGQGDYFEIWSPESWDIQETELRKTDSNTERFSTFEITTR